MKKVNFYKKKYEALETFYGWVDQSSDYNIAVEQSIYYDNIEDDLDKIIFNITVATRFARCGKEISNTFRERLEGIITKYKILNIEVYNLCEKEKSILDEEVKEIKIMLQE